MNSWKTLSLQAKSMSDTQLKQHLYATSLYQVLQKLYFYNPETMEVQPKQFLLTSPQELNFNWDLSNLHLEYPYLTPDQILSLYQSLESQFETFSNFLEQGQLKLFYTDLVKDVYESLLNPIE
jgi:hypothetical protein